MPRIPHYGQEKLDQGKAYQQFVRDRINRYGLMYWDNDDPLFQLTAENSQGIEIKLDLRARDRLSIEVAEKSDPRNDLWIPSGIFKPDNSWAYVQGTYEVIFVFSKKWLVRYHKEKAPPIYEDHGTIQKFYLSMEDAYVACLLAVDKDGKRIDLMNGGGP